MTNRAAGVVALVWLSLAGCGSDSNRGDHADGGGGGEDAAPGQPDAGGGGPSLVGTVLVLENQGGGPGTFATAVFADQFFLGPALGSAGGCTLYGDTIERGMNAGPVTIASPPTSFVMVP